MKRDPGSHKGENGKVAIVGGSLHQHGAPLFAALAAEASGVDLLYVVVPRCHSEVAKFSSLNFQIHPFGSDEEPDEMSRADIAAVVELLATMDSAVIGPGFTRSQRGLKVLQELIDEASCPLVLDASALQPWTMSAIEEKHAVLTPHLGELERLGLETGDLASAAKAAGATIVLKAAENTVVSESGKMQTVGGGHAGLTVGGTGDATAGLICGLVSQGIDHFDACVMASTIIKQAGTMLSKEYGYAYGTRRVIEMIPKLLRSL